MLVALILPQLILQFTEKGTGFKGSNIQSIKGSLKKYRQAIESRVGVNGTDTSALEVLKNPASTQQEIEAALRNSSPEFQKQATLVNNNVAALERYVKTVKASAHPLQALGSNLKNIGLSLLSNFVQAGAFWLASKFIEGAIRLVDSFVNRLEYAKEAAENLNKAYEDMNTTQKQNTKTVEEYGKTWDKLREGVDQNGNNVSLTDDEYAQYKNAIEQISNVIPGITGGWNDSNEAIKLNISSVDDLKLNAR